MLAFDAELLRRYDRPGPRYTSYPTAPHFHDGFDEAALRRQVAASNGASVNRGMSLYVHVPFCTNPCFYCGCTRVITRDAAKGAAYLHRVLREIAILAPAFDRDRQVVQLHLGGGTPNFLTPAQLGELVDAISRRFVLAPPTDRDVSIELDPRFVAPADIAGLADIGFNRASLGVQDFDPVVQRAVNRVQSVDETRRIVDACREHGFRSVNIDLIYGLPKQTLDGFGRTLDAVIAARPDRLAIYGYAHLPQLFRAQRRIEAGDLPNAPLRLALLQLAIERLREAGYRYIGMDHFALPQDDLARAQDRGGLRRNFMGYTTHARTDLVGFGVSAISRVGDSYWQNHRDLPGWEAAVDAGRLPLWRGLALLPDDRIREDVIQRLMCQGEIDVAAIEAQHGIDFDTYFHAALPRLQALQADGLIAPAARGWVATARGRLLLRVVGMCFDAYLDSGTARPAQQARAI